MHVGGIFSDLTKAYDCVSHGILLAELHFYGIWGVSEDWFRSCFTNKRQKVEVKSPNTAIFFSCLGYIETWSSPRINSKVSGVHNIYKWPSSENKFYIRTSIICWWCQCHNSKRNFKNFCSLSNLVLYHMIKWFAANNLVINLYKMNIMKFITYSITYCL